MSKQREALEKALLALEIAPLDHNSVKSSFFEKRHYAIIALREALAEPARKSLTDEQIDAEFNRECWVTVVFADGARGIALDSVTARDFARAIERAHGITE